VTLSLTEYSGDPEYWDTVCSMHAGSHLLQSFEWGEVKRVSGWQPSRVIAYKDAKAVSHVQVLFKGFHKLRFAYVPKGPVIDRVEDLPEVLTALEGFCRKRGACTLQVDLPFPGTPEPLPRGWKLAHPVQPQTTLVVELTDPHRMLASMRPKTRYNLRLAQKKGVKVTPRQDAQAMEAFYRLLLDTAKRDGFGIHPLSYYMEFWKQFVVRDLAVVFLAEVDSSTLAGLVAARWGTQAYYLYGASASYGREFMASYLLQWEAMMWARARGCHSYDLWGVPAEAEAGLSEEEIEHRRIKEGGLWGVYRFKSGFGGSLVKYTAVRKDLTVPGKLLYVLKELRRK
jgi:lipid II:glycine glycyltransferase (peptidoglycan interpeptide bridge formation enzyme)